MRSAAHRVYCPVSLSKISLKIRPFLGKIRNFGSASKNWREINNIKWNQIRYRWICSTWTIQNKSCDFNINRIVISGFKSPGSFIEHPRAGRAGAILLLNNYNGAGALITYIFNRIQSKNSKAFCYSIPKTYIFLKLKITSSKIELTLTLGS